MIDLIEDLSNDANKIGLTEDRIRPRVNIRLRQLNLKPIFRIESGYLYINISVISNAYNISLSFNRTVHFYKDDNINDGLYRMTGAKVWCSGSTGVHGGNADFIMTGLERHLDRFLSDYLDAND